jgi:hypothetical protein
MYCLIHNCSLAKLPRRLKHVLGTVQAGGLKLWGGEHTRDKVGSCVSIRPRDIPPGGLSSGILRVDTMAQRHTGVFRAV